MLIDDNSFDVNPRFKFDIQENFLLDPNGQQTMYIMAMTKILFVYMRLMNYHTHIVYINIVLINTLFISCCTMCITIGTLITTSYYIRTTRMKPQVCLVHNND